jgi:hypothetical protein
MIGRPAGRLRTDPRETEIGQIKPTNKNVDNANRIVLVDPILQALRKQRALGAILPFNEALHPDPPQNGTGILQRESHQAQRFYTIWVKSVGLVVPRPRPLWP